MKWPKNRSIVIAMAGLLVFALTAGTMAGSTLTVYLWDGAGDADQIAAFLNEDSTFAQQHPDITVEILTVTPEVGRTEQLVVWEAAGMSPDIVDVNDGVIISMADQGYFRDLLPFLEADAELDRESFLAAGIQSMLQSDGLLGLPTGMQVMAMYQNVSMFEDAGVAVLAPDEEWSWSDFEDLMGRLRRSDGDETVQWGHGIHAGLGRVSSWIWQSGARFWNDDISASMLNTPEAVEALQFMQDLVQRDLIPTENSWGVNDMFLDGKLGTLQEGTWTIDHFTQVMPFEAAMTLPPRHRESATRAAVNGFGITTATDQPDAAWELVKFMASREFYEAVEAWRTTSIPTLLGEQTMWVELMESSYPELQGTEAFVHALDHARTMHRPGQTSSIWGELMGQLWSGEVSPVNVAEELTTRFNAELQ